MSLLLMGAGPGTDSAGPWTPPSAAIALGAYYDISDISTLFKDTAGTTAVTADGDLVARVNDKSGNGYHLLQATSGNRPIYRTNSGKPYLELSGASPTYLQVNSVQLVNATDGTHSSGFGVYFANNTGTQRIAGNDDLSTRIFFLQNNAGPLEVFNYNTSNANVMNDGGATITAAATLTAIEVTNTGTTEAFVNNSSAGNSAIFGSPPLNNVAGVLSVGAIPGGSNPMTGRFYAGAIYRGALGSTDRGSLHTWLAAKF